MLKDRTAEALLNQAETLRVAAAAAEDACVKERICERAGDFERLVTLITPVLAPSEDANAAR